MADKIIFKTLMLKGDAGNPTDEQTQAAVDEYMQHHPEAAIDETIINSAVSDWLDDHPEATTSIEDGSLTESKFSDTLKLSAIKDYVTPEMFGAKGDGITDDSSAIQDAIDNDDGKSVLFTKIYGVASTIDNSNGVSLFGINGATIKCVSSMSDMLTMTRYEVSAPHVISGLVFDGNSLCDNGLTINYCTNVLIENCRSRDFLKIHFNLKAGYECFVQNVYARNAIAYDANNTITAFYIKVSDSVFTNCVTVNFDLGFDVNTNVFLIGCHPWNNDTDFVKNSIGIITKANPYIKDCELDNCKFGVYVSGYYSVHMDSCRFIFGSTISNFTNTYVYLETGTLSYADACYFGKSGSTCTLCSRPQNLSVNGAVFGSGATFTDTYTNRRLLMSSDERYQLIIADGTSFSLAAGATVTKTYTISGIKAFDSIVCNVVYDTSGIIYKVVPQADAIKVICINPTDATLSTSYARINVIVNHANGGNVAYTWTSVSEAVL